MPRPEKKREELVLFPNPYHCFGKGVDLGGAPDRPEEDYGFGRPARLLIGAERKHSDYEARDHLTGGKEEMKGARSRANVFFVFGVEPVTCLVTQTTRKAYQDLIDNEMVFECVDGEIPMAKLAAARAALLKQHEALGEHPAREDLDFEWWAEQFPLDPDVVAFTADAPSNEES